MTSKPDYFATASSWADDQYYHLLRECQRWRRCSLLVLLPMVFCLLLALCGLIPSQHIQPLLIHHYDNGMVSVEPIDSRMINSHRALQESEVVRYLINRESYSAASYPSQYKLVNLLSSRGVAAQYRREQDSKNQQSPIHRLGPQGYRTVRVESVVLLNQSKHQQTKANAGRHLAQANMTLIDHLHGDIQQHPITVILAWSYLGMTKSPALRWQNWDGFTVNFYEKQPRNVGK